LKNKWIISSQEAWAIVDFRWRRSSGLVEGSALFLEVVDSARAPQLFTAFEEAEVDVASGFGVGGFFVVVDLIGLEQELRRLNLNATAQVVFLPFDAVGDRTDRHLTRSGRVHSSRAPGLLCNCIRNCKCNKSKKVVTKSPECDTN
jgi:hypothetical protein